MALDTLDTIARRVLLRFPAAGYPLAREWVDFAFRQVAERRRWSWLVKENQFLFPLPVTAGTVTMTRSSNAVVGSGTAFTGAMEGNRAQDFERYPEPISAYMDTKDPSERLDALSAGVGGIYVAITDAVGLPLLVLTRGAGVQGATDGIESWQKNVRERYLGPVRGGM